MDIKFLSCLIPDSLKNEVKIKSHSIMQDAANALQWNIYNGLCQNYNQEIQLINILPIGSFPQYYTDCFIHQINFDTSCSNKNINVGFCNIKYLRKFLQRKNIYHVLTQLYDEIDEGILFVYTISDTFLKPIYKLKKHKPNIKVCAIVADLPNMINLSNRKTLCQKIYERESANHSYSHLSCINAYVLLTKYMSEYLKINKPYCVMEGISTISSNNTSNCNKDENKIILYTGTLHEKFGILNLLEAFRRINKENYQLVICGVGDSSDTIRNAANKDKRIRFLGQVSREEALVLQSEATVLVNPRQNNEEFTRYSFPSKTMEYLSSGKPVIAYKLDGIPDEYDDFICYVRDNSIASLTSTIIDICEKDEVQRNIIGQKGRKFVVEEKNAFKQTLKIKHMIDNL